MRVFGFLLMFLVQPALVQPTLAAEEPVRLAFARFAYASSSAFHNSLEQPAPEQPSRLEKRLPFLPLKVFGEEQLVDQPPKVPLPLVKSAETEPSPPARLETASAEPVAVEPEPTPANEIAAGKPIAAEPPFATQRLASLPEPMHLLPRTPTAEITATDLAPSVAKSRKHEPEAKPSRSRSRTNRQARSAPQAHPQPQPKTAQNADAAKIPAWAQQMFDSNWQNHSFAYQR